MSSNTYYILPQAALTVLLQEGVDLLKANPQLVENIFAFYKAPGMSNRYGQRYIDEILTWWNATPIPIKQSWGLNVTQVPSITIRLSSENEETSKEALQDYYGQGDDAPIGVSTFKVSLDILLLASKTTDEVLWLYHIAQYLLFITKARAEGLGLQGAEFSATDFTRDVGRLPDNVYARSIKYSCSVQQFFDGVQYLNIEAIEGEVEFESANRIVEPVIRTFEV